jgi:hypothetical protein
MVASECRDDRRAIPLLVAAALLWGVVSHAGDLARREEVERAVRPIGVVADRAVVQGQVQNLSDAELRDVRLLVIHEFRWADEMHPGPASPGRSETIVVARIPPRETVAFHHGIAPPLPIRDDGAYSTRVEILGFTQIGP